MGRRWSTRGTPRGRWTGTVTLNLSFLGWLVSLYTMPALTWYKGLPAILGTAGPCRGHRHHIAQGVLPTNERCLV